MNRQQWYKQRKLFRIKKLVYFSYGDEAPTEVYEDYEHFDLIIKNSVIWRNESAFNIPELFDRTARFKQDANLKVDMAKWYETLRQCMRTNAHMGVVTSCGSTPCGYYDLRPTKRPNLP